MGWCWCCYFWVFGGWVALRRWLRRRSSRWCVRRCRRWNFWCCCELFSFCFIFSGWMGSILSVFRRRWIGCMVWIVCDLWTRSLLGSARWWWICFGISRIRVLVFFWCMVIFVLLSFLGSSVCVCCWLCCFLMFWSIVSIFRWFKLVWLILLICNFVLWLLVCWMIVWDCCRRMLVLVLWGLWVLWRWLWMWWCLYWWLFLFVCVWCVVLWCCVVVCVVVLVWIVVCLNEIYIYILEGFKYVFFCEYDLFCV